MKLNDGAPKKDVTLEPYLVEQLRQEINQHSAAGSLMTVAQIGEQLAKFRDRFGPPRLQALDGEALLQFMHGRQQGPEKCLMYWLEFKDDEDFRGPRFGSIAGGSALKFGIFQRAADATWITGSPQDQIVLSVADASAVARKQRDELLAGCAALDVHDPSDTSDENYVRLQLAMEAASPELVNSAWAHKYWFLLYSDRLDELHSWNHQSFYSFKLLQRPPVIPSSVQSKAPRFLLAGRFVAAARELEVPVPVLNQVMFIRYGPPRRYWKVGTTEGSDGSSHWDAMRKGRFVSIGWADVPDLTDKLNSDKTTLKNLVRGFIEQQYSTPNMATRKAGEIVDFAQTIEVEDLVVACSGSSVLEIGKVDEPYQYDESLEFPHKRPVKWLSLEPWTLPEVEGPRTSVFPFGKKELNRLELERRLSRVGEIDFPNTPITPQVTDEVALPSLDALTSRLESILLRKGQVILYGPPGTGKTFGALRAANELAARSIFGRPFASLTGEQSIQITGNTAGIVRMCTFHPGWGYEDFMEGLRPVTNEGHMLFEARDGILKVLCADARKAPKQNFYLVIDEINRGDLPRIFGELITSIEYDKRERPIRLPITGSSFSVPKNVFLIGTMNTADRSISLLDAALRRRFGFIELMPDSSLLAGRRAGKLPLGAWLDTLNARLLRYLKRDARNLQVGHSYLMTLQAKGSLAEFGRVLRDDIIPLLEEYCYSDFAALEEILGKSLVDAEAGRIRDEIFDPKREDELLEAVSFEELQSLVLMKPEEAILEAVIDSDSEDEEILGEDQN